MEVLLTTDVDNLGYTGDTVKVKSGYARNYLLPMGLAVMPTPHALRQIEQKRKQQEEKRAAERSSADDMAKKLEGLSVTVQAKADEHESLYGSVNAQMVATQLKEEHGVEIQLDQIHIAETIKELGTFVVEIKLHKDVIVPVKVWVVKSDD